MKLSSRKKLLEESDIILLKIREKIKEERLDESNVSNLLSNLVNAIVGGIEKMVRTGKQSWIQYRMPYLVGLDLINNSNIKVDQSILKKLDSIINDIIQDVRKSPELKSAMSDVRSASADAYGKRFLYQQYSSGRVNLDKIKSKKIRSAYENSLENYEKAEQKFQDLLLKRVTELIRKIILQNNKYRNFDEMVLDKLKSGIRGITPGELKQIQQKYFDTLTKRVTREVELYDFKRGLTPYEREERYLDMIGGPA